MKLTDVSDSELVTSMKSLCLEGRRIDALLIAHLVEVEDRRIHLEAACSSLFDFCTRRLGMSEGAAFRRIVAARLARRFPSLLGHLESARIHLSSLVLLRDHLTAENVEELIAAASGMSTRKVEQLVARIAPRPDVPSVIRKLPSPAVAAPNPTPSPSPSPTEGSAPNALTAPAPVPSPPVPSAQSGLPFDVPPSVPPRPARALTPLSEARYKVQLTAGVELRDKLERARDLMCHRNPSGDLAVVVERALDALLEKLEKERLGAVSRPRAKPNANGNAIANAKADETGREPQRTRSTADIPRAVRRAVFARDGEQCTFRSADGERCPSRTLLELDHIRARARDGAPSEANIRVLCKSHNRLHAEHDFGRAHVESRIHFRRRKLHRDTHPSVETRTGHHSHDDASPAEENSRG